MYRNQPPVVGNDVSGTKNGIYAVASASSRYSTSKYRDSPLRNVVWPKDAHSTIGFVVVNVCIRHLQRTDIMHTAAAKLHFLWS